MLINLSNHPLSSWSADQIEKAKNLFNEVFDIPFPQIPPHADETEVELKAQNTAKEILNIISKYPNQNNAVHIMGEMTFSFSLVNILLDKGINCVASTTERNVTEMDNKKITEFSFVSFRPFKIPTL